MSVFLNLAQQILSETLMPMTAPEIWEYYLENKYKYTFKTSGQTPWYTLSALLQKQVKGVSSTRFVQTSFSPAKYGLKSLDYERIEEFSIVKPTSKEIITNTRIGQNPFRDKLLRLMTHCPVSGIDDRRLLVASHIKPWSKSNDIERLDENNGLIFSLNIDGLFDKGLITFDFDTRLLVSQSLTHDNIKRLHITPNRRTPDLPVVGREVYLDYHRKFVFMP